MSKNFNMMDIGNQFDFSDDLTPSNEGYSSNVKRSKYHPIDITIKSPDLDNPENVLRLLAVESFIKENHVISQQLVKYALECNLELTYNKLGFFTEKPSKQSLYPTLEEISSGAQEVSTAHLNTAIAKVEKAMLGGQSSFEERKSFLLSLIGDNKSLSEKIANEFGDLVQKEECEIFSYPEATPGQYSSQLDIAFEQSSASLPSLKLNRSTDATLLLNPSIYDSSAELVKYLLSSFDEIKERLSTPVSGEGDMTRRIDILTHTLNNLSLLVEAIKSQRTALLDLSESVSSNQ